MYIAAPGAEQRVSSSSRGASPLVFYRTQSKQTLYIDATAGKGGSSKTNYGMSKADDAGHGRYGGIPLQDARC